jgi:RNA polymerase sigma-70 factor (family 1)
VKRKIVEPLTYLSNLKNIQEDELLRSVAEGSEAAFRILYLKYHHRLGAFIYRLTDSHETSEEIVQDVFLRIWQNREKLESIKSFKAYLFVMSKNQAFNCLKKAVAEKVKFLKLESHYEELYAEESAEIEIDRYALLDKAIEQLPEQQKRAYLLSKHKRLTYEQVAKEMNLSPETVKKYLKIAMASISNHVKESSHSQFIIINSLYFFYFS